MYASICINCLSSFLSSLYRNLSDFFHDIISVFVKFLGVCLCFGMSQPHFSVVSVFEIVLPVFRRHVWFYFLNRASRYCLKHNIVTQASIGRTYTCVRVKRVGMRNRLCNCRDLLSLSITSTARYERMQALSVIITLRKA